MTLPQFRALQRHWEKHPPLSLLMEAYMGFKPASKPVRATRESLGRIVRQFGKKA